MEEIKPKRTRRSEDQLLTDTITSLYEKIQAKIQKIDDERNCVEEIFDALSPLIKLELTYRMANGPIPRVIND